MAAAAAAGNAEEKNPGEERSQFAWPAPRHARKMLVLGGCVQPALAPSINAAAARVLDRLGISLIEAPGAGCCGGVRFHLNRHEAGRDDMRALIDAWWPLVEAQQVEAIVMTASGCGVTVKDYAHLLAHDPAYRDKAARISALARDLCEVVPADFPQIRAERGPQSRVAFQSPCTLQHGQQIRGRVEASARARRLRADAGARRAPVLRLGGHLLDPAAGDRRRAARAQARRAAGRRRAVHRHRQHRLPDAPAGGERGAGAPLDRAGRRGAGAQGYVVKSAP